MAGSQRKIWEKAKTIINDPPGVRDLLDEAKSYLNEKISEQPALEEIVDHIKVLTRMVQAHFKGYYKSFSTQTVLVLVFGLLYFVTPTDVIPDFIPALGFTDDITLIYYLVSFIERDIEAFKKWELQGSAINENNA